MSLKRIAFKPCFGVIVRTENVQVEFLEQVYFFQFVETLAITIFKVQFSDLIKQH